MLVYGPDGNGAGPGDRDRPQEREGVGLGAGPPGLDWFPGPGFLPFPSGLRWVWAWAAVGFSSLFISKLFYS